jgi:large subunit ribosomal protein L5
MSANLYSDNLNRFYEKQYHIDSLNNVTIFPYINLHQKANFYKLILNFSLKDLDFNKKKALPFFLAMELLTNQKCIATLSSKNVLFWKLRKGSLVGCKITLRKKNLYDFIDNLNLTLPRMEKFKGIPFKTLLNNPTQDFAIKISELLLFYPIELGLGINTEVKKIEINFLFKKIAHEEKSFLLTSNKIPLIK